MKRKLICHHNNDPKHTSINNRNKVESSEWPSRSPDLNSIEHVWDDRKRAVHRGCPYNLSDLEWVCKEERANNATSRCPMLLGP